MAKKTQKAEPSGRDDLTGKLAVLATLVSAQLGVLTEDGADWHEPWAIAEKMGAGQTAQGAQEPAEA